MGQTIHILQRELRGYFETPIAYVFLVIFVMMSGLLTFRLGGLFERGQADLLTFFQFHPWLYLIFIPALAMRLWAEERRSGTLELLMTLPIGMTEAILGKFLAAWLFTALALALTFPMWVTVNYLGAPDNGAILAGYIGSWLLAGAFLAIGECLSALTKNQVIAFVLAVVISLLFVLAGQGLVLDFFAGWAPDLLLEAISGFSFLTHFDAISKGVIDLRDLIYFASLIAFWLYATAVIIDLKKAD